jgi:hypothetical protein
MKRYIFAILVVIILIAGVIGGFIYIQKSNEQVAVLQKEATALAEKDITSEDIDMEIKTTGKYAIVEQTMKEYLNNARSIYVEVTDYCNDDAITNILSTENIEQDETGLTVVEEKLEEYNDNLDKKMNEFETIVTEQNIKNAIKEKGLRSYYNDIYENVMLSDAVTQNLENAKLGIMSAQEKAQEKLEGLSDVVDFLKENTKYWNLEDGKIQFTNINKLTQYYELLNKAM